MKVVKRGPPPQQLAAFGASDSEKEEDEAMPDAQENAEAAANLQAQGLAHAEKGEYLPALSCWNRALRLDQDNATLHEEIAQVYLELGRDFEALQAATRATLLAPCMAEAFLTLSRAQLNYGEPILAQTSMERVLQIEPTHPEALEEINHVRVVAMKQSRAAVGMRAHVIQPGM